MAMKKQSAEEAEKASAKLETLRRRLDDGNLEGLLQIRNTFGMLSLCMGKKPVATFHRQRVVLYLTGSRREEALENIPRAHLWENLRGGTKPMKNWVAMSHRQALLHLPLFRDELLLSLADTGSTPSP